MKYKLLTILSVVLIGIIGFSSFVLADQPGVNFWNYNFSTGLLSLKNSITQLVIGGSSTSTSAKLEVYGDAYVSSTLTTGEVCLDGDCISDWGSIQGENFWADDGTYLSPVTSTRIVSADNAVFENNTTTNLMFGNATGVSAFIGTLELMNGIFGDTTTTNSIIGTLTAMTGSIGDLFASTLSSVTSTIANLTATTLNITGALLDSSNATGTAGQLLSSTGTSTKWISTSTLGFLSTETDPIWSLASTSVGYLSNNQTWTGENTFTATTTFPYGSWIGDTLGSKSIQFTDYTIPTTFAVGNKINKISAKNDLNFLAMENALFVFANDGEDPLIGLGREDSNYLTLLGTSLEDNTFGITQIDETVSPITFSDFTVGTEKISLISGSATSTLNFNNNAEISLNPSDVMNFTGASGYYFDGTTTASCLSNDGINCFANLWFQNGADIYYNGGFVGIGTTTPQAPLHLVSTTTTEPVLILGNTTNIAGAKAISIGYGAEAIGISSVALGADTDADGENAVSIGKDSIAKGLNSTAIGKTATSRGDYSVSLGNFVNASNTYAIAIGNNQTVTGEGAIGMGFGGNVSGNYSSAIGGNNLNVSGGLSGIYGGFYNSVSGFQSIITGGQYNNNAGTRSGISSGQYNTIQAGATDSFIAAGVGNTIGPTGYYTNIIGGLYSYASDFGSTVIGSIYATSTNSGIIMNSQSASADGFGAMILSSLGATVVGVCTGIIESDYVTVVADYSLMLDSMFSTIQTLPGNATTTKAFMANSMYSNITTSTATLITSNYSNLAGIGSVIIGGEYNNVTGTNSFAMGSGINITGNRSFGINLAPSTSPMTISNTSTMAIMGGNVGIGTTSPAFTLSVVSTTNWLQLSTGIHGFNFTWETSTIDYPLISGLSSSTDLLGGDLPIVALKDRALIVGDDNPSISFSVFTDVLTKIATIAFDTINEIMNFSGAKSWVWRDYDTGESEIFKIDAENSDVYITSGSSWAGYATCYTTNGELGHCTSAVNSSGQCTCVSNN